MLTVLYLKTNLDLCFDILVYKKYLVIISTAHNLLKFVMTIFPVFFNYVVFVDHWPCHKTFMQEMVNV